MRYIDARPTPKTTELVITPTVPDAVPTKYADANANHLEQLAEEVLAGVPDEQALTIVNRAMRDPQFTGITKDSLTFHKIHFADEYMHKEEM